MILAHGMAHSWRLGGACKDQFTLLQCAVEINAGHQSGQQVPFPTEPSRPLLFSTSINVSVYNPAQIFVCDEIEIRFHFFLTPLPLFQSLYRNKLPFPRNVLPYCGTVAIICASILGLYIFICQFIYPDINVLIS